jgi:peptidoglycan/LPS O-acetylase OafA/YrhL
VGSLPSDPLVVRPRHYRPEIDGLRALAVIAVWINHLNHRLLPGGFLGVDVFFVISGYVVTSSMLGRHENDWAEFLRHFYQRRFRRLMPALIANIVLVAVLFSVFVSPLDEVRIPSLRTGLAALFGVSNLYLLKQGTNYFSASTQYNIFTHTWSLGVEEQYYLLWPIVLLLCGVGASLARHGLHRLIVVSSLLASASLLFYLLLSFAGKQDAAFFLMPARFWELGAGSLAFILHSRGLHEPAGKFPWLRQKLEWPLFAGLLSVLFLPDSHPVAGTVAVVLFTSAILSVIDSAGRLSRGLAHPFALAIGVRSYSLYLWHWPVIVLARWTWGISLLTVIPIVLVTSLLTLASYKLENFFRYREPTGFLPSRPLFFYPILAILGGAVVFLLQGQLRWLFFAGRRIGELNVNANIKSIQGTSVSTINCFREPIAPVDKGDADSKCRAEVSRDLPTLYFEGDSHTQALIPLGEKIFQSGQYNVAFYARGGCPFPYFSPWPEQRHASERYRLCQPHYEARLARLLPALRKGDALVLVSNIAGSFLGMEEKSVQAAEASYERQISRLSKKLEEVGAHLILFAPIPTFFDRQEIVMPITACSPEWYRPRWALAQECRPSFLKRSEHLKFSSRSELLFERLSDKFHNVSIFRPIDTICPESLLVCSSHRGDEMLYSDGNHLSNYGASILYPEFMNFLHHLKPRVSG